MISPSGHRKQENGDLQAALDCPARMAPFFCVSFFDNKAKLIRTNQMVPVHAQGVRTTNAVWSVLPTIPVSGSLAGTQDLAGAQLLLRTMRVITAGPLFRYWPFCQSPAQATRARITLAGFSAGKQNRS